MIVERWLTTHSKEGMTIFEILIKFGPNLEKTSAEETLKMKKKSKSRNLRRRGLEYYFSLFCKSSYL